MSNANVEVRDSAMLAIVDASLPFRRCDNLFTEGPLRDVRNRLLFSDIPGNVISAWSGGAQDFRRPSSMSMA